MLDRSIAEHDRLESARPGLWTALACAAILAAGLAAYSDSLRGPFIFDDPINLDQPTSKTLWPIWPTLIALRPVVHFTWALCYCIGGPGPLGYHTFNVAVHLLAALALFGIVRRTLTLPAMKGRFEENAATAIAFCAALIWMLHPIQTQAVTYVVQRLESLMGLFYLLTLYCFIRSASSPRPIRWHAATVASCLLGMGSKEVMVSAPLIVLLYDRVFITGSFGETLRRRWGLYLALAATWLGLGYSIGAAFATQADSAGFNLPEHTPLEYARTEFSVILHYLRLAFLPTGLCLDYADWPVAKGIWDIVPGAAVVGALLAATAWALARRPMWGFAGAWFFLVLAPTSSVLPIDDLAFEHRMYLPMAPLVTACVVASYGLGSRLIRRMAASTESRKLVGRAAATAAVLSVAGVLGWITFDRNRDYSDAIALWQDTVGKRPLNARAWNNLGYAYFQTGRTDPALYCYNKAIGLMPASFLPYNGRGVAYSRLGRYDEAVRDFGQAIALKPDYAEAWFNRGTANAKAGHAEEAMRDLGQAIALKPDFGEAYLSRAVAEYAAKNYPRAMADVREAQRCGARPNPDFLRALDEAVR